MADGEARNTNFRLLGRMTSDPEVKRVGSGKLVANFMVAWNRKGMKSVMIPFVCFDSDTSLYISENFKCGDLIHVLESSPGWDDRRGRLQFTVWNVMAPYKEINNAGNDDSNGPTGDEPPY